MILVQILLNAYITIHEIMLYSQYPSKNFQVEICVLSNLKYSDEMTVSQDNFNCAQKL